MKEECLGQLHQSTTLFPQRICKSRSTVNYFLDKRNFHSNDSNCLKSAKNNEKQQFLFKEVQETILKTEENNVMCENTNTKGVSDSLTTPNDKGLTEPEVVTCFVCRKNILKDLISEHLLIGQVKCMSCSFIFKSCNTFQRRTVEMEIGIDICDHMLQYLNDPRETLKLCYSRYHMSSSKVTEQIESKVNAYLNQIESLKNRYPWKEVLNNSVKLASNASLVSRSKGFIENSVVGSFRNSRSFSSENTFQDKSYLNAGFVKLCKTDSIVNPITYSNDHVSKENEHEAKDDNQANAKSSGSKNSSLSHERQFHCTKKKANHMLKVKKRGANFHYGESNRKVLVSQNKKFKKLVEMPSDGFYYIAKHSVTECPNCYNVLKPQDFSVNIVTFLMTAICSDCGLIVYIVEEQTDGECPTVCIVTDEESVIKAP